MSLRLRSTRCQAAAIPPALTVDSPICDFLAALEDEENSFSEFKLLRDAADKRVMELPDVPAGLRSKLDECLAVLDSAAVALQRVTVAASTAKVDQVLADKISAALEFQLAYVLAAFDTRVNDVLASDGPGGAKRAKP